MTILAYIPDPESAELFRAKLSESYDGGKVIVDTDPNEYLKHVQTTLNVDGTIVTHDGSFDTLFSATLEAGDDLPVIVLAPHETISAVQSKIGAHPVLPLPGTPIAARVLLSPDPANDPGCLINDFQLTQLVSYGRMTHTFEARQTSIDRPVFLHLLNSEHLADEMVRAEFLADLQAKARANHESLIPVFQAINDGDRLFFTAEHLKTETLRNVIDDGRTIAPLLALRIAHAASSALMSLNGAKVSAHPLEEEHVFLIPEAVDHCRIENVAFSGSMTEAQHLNNLHSFLATLPRAINPDDEHAAPVIEWIASAKEFTSLREIAIDARKKLARLEGRGTIVDPPTHQPAVRPGGGTAGRRNVSSGKIPLPAVIAVVALLALIIFFVSRGGGGESVELRDHSKIVEIPGGTLTTPEGSAEVEPFWIDAYEVTIGQYAEFLNFIESNQGVDYIDHRDQPTSKRNHVPADWETYYPVAVKGGKYSSHRLTLNYPVFNVDWWDAYAYARWKERRLPTAAEWEFAARGEAARKFSWGNDWAPEKTNSGLDSAKSTTAKPGKVDGFANWSPVDRPLADVTPEGVYGMTGNVSEWTDTLFPDSIDPDKLVPIIKGGSFVSKSINLSEQKLPKSRDQRSALVGFRTVSSRAPSQ